MSSATPPVLDQQVESLVATFLRYGVRLAAGVAIVGGVLALFQHGTARSDYHLFVGEPAALRSLPGIVAAAFQGDSRAIVQLGLVLLIATPIGRVLITLLAFFRKRDWTYTVIAAIVLGILMVSLLLGGGAR